LALFIRDGEVSSEAALPSVIRSAFRGRLYRLASSVYLASMHACMHFVSAKIHPFEVIFFRDLFGFVVLVP
jgi:hypothetical protein